MPRMRKWVLHCTYRYVTKQKETGETYSSQSRPTISVEATTERAARDKALKQCRKRTSSDWWPVISDAPGVRARPGSGAGLMTGGTISHAEHASDLEARAGNVLARATGMHPASEARRDAMLQGAALAGLAQSHRIAALTEALGEYLGDDSHIDGIKTAIRDGLESIRADGVGVG